SHQAPPSEAPEAPEAPQAKAPAPETPGQEAPPAPPAEAAAPDAAAPAAPEARAPQQTPPRPAVPATPPVAPPPAPPVGQPPAPPAATPAPAPSAPDEPAQAPAAPGKKGWRERLGVSGFARSLGGLFSNNPRLDDDLLDEIETALLVADVGVAATTGLVEPMLKRRRARESAGAAALRRGLPGAMVALLRPVAQRLAIDPAAKPFVILTVGVNGVGKPTTSGKLARRYKEEGHGLMLAAGDTFRAAA